MDLFGTQFEEMQTIMVEPEVAGYIVSTVRKQSEQEMGLGYEISRSTPIDSLPLSKLSLLKVLPSSKTAPPAWEPCVQTLWLTVDALDSAIISMKPWSPDWIKVPAKFPG